MDVVDAEHREAVNKETIEQLNLQVDYLNSQLQNYWEKDAKLGINKQAVAPKTPVKSQPPPTPSKTPAKLKSDNEMMAQQLSYV